MARDEWLDQREREAETRVTAAQFWMDQATLAGDCKWEAGRRATHVDRRRRRTHARLPPTGVRLSPTA